MVYGVKGSREIKETETRSFCEPIALMRWSWMYERRFGGMVPTVSSLVRILKIVSVEVISKPRFYNTFDYFERLEIGW